MTWKQSSKRDFTFIKPQTSATVGPGSYNLIKPIIPITNQKRLPLRKNIPQKADQFLPSFITPGPGYYELDQGSIIQNRSQSACFKSRSIRFRNVSSSTPSSASYGTLKNWTKDQQTHIGYPHHLLKKSTHHETPKTCNFLDEKGRLIYIPEVNHKPEDIGPGTYYPYIDHLNRFSQINTADRKIDFYETNTPTPGPGTYFVEDTPNTHSITIGKKYADKENPVNDSIGQPITDFVTSNRPNSVFLSKTQRSSYFDSESSSTPGPGQYCQSDNTQVHQVPKTSFGTRSVRFPKKSIDSTPSPDAYNPNSSTVINRPSPSFASLPESTRKAAECVPGPGSYDIPDQLVKVTQRSPAFADHSERGFFKDDGFPSAADYFVRQEKPTAIIGKPPMSSKRECGIWQTTQSISPSPETYNVSRDFPSKPMTIPKAPRFQEKRRKEKIGPGSYETNDTAFKVHSYNSGVPCNNK